MSAASAVSTASMMSVAPAVTASSIVSRLAANMATVAHAGNCTVLPVLSVTARAWALPMTQPSAIALAR